MNNIRLQKVIQHAMLASNNSTMGRANYAKHLDECIWNPTIGGIAEQQYVLKSQNRFHKLNPRMKYLIDILDNTKEQTISKDKKKLEIILSKITD